MGRRGLRSPGTETMKEEGSGRGGVERGSSTSGELEREMVARGRRDGVAGAS